jgi:hypothetical protein
MSSWWTSGWSSWTGGWAAGRGGDGGWDGGWAASSGGVDSWKSREDTPLPPQTHTDIEEEVGQKQKSDLGEVNDDLIRLKKAERSSCTILDKYHRMRRESMSVLALRRFACLEADTHVLNDPICDSNVDDGFLMAKKVSKKAANAVRSTWDNMNAFAQAVKKKKAISVAAPPQVHYMIVGEGKRVEDCPSDHEGTTKDNWDDEASSADAHNDHDLDDGVTVVSSHLSLRSSTRMTPSKARRGRERAALHQASKKVKVDTDGDESEGEATDKEGADEEEERVQDHPSNLGQSVLKGMDSVPNERRTEFLEKLSSFIMNFLSPPGPLVPANASSAGTTGAAALAAPTSPVASPTSPVSSAASTPPPPPPPRPVSSPIVVRPPQQYSNCGVGQREAVVVRPPQQYSNCGVGQREAVVVRPPPPPPPRPLPGAGLPSPSPPTYEQAHRVLQTRLMLYQERACPLCSKLLTGTHACGQTHMAKLAEHLQLDLMLGIPTSIRNLTPMECKACWCSRDAPLCKRRVREAWGDAVENLCAFAKRRVKELGGYQAEKRWVEYDPSWTYSLGLVPYSGGRYTSDQVCVPWEALPEDDDPPNSGGAASSWEGQGAMQVADPHVLYEQTGWWPVVSITHRTTTLVRCGGTVVVVVCVYQWMWDRPTGWRIRVVETRSRL